MDLEDLITIESPNLRVRSRESVHREFKEIYDPKALAKYAKTIAAMANTDGGHVLFGIADRPNRLVGIEPDTIPDTATLSNSFENWFDPHINFTVHELTFDGKTVMVVKVKECTMKPVICKKTVTVKETKTKKGKTETKDKTILSEGAVYRRYSGKTEQIHFPELQEIFIERDQKTFSALLESLNNIRRIGVERVGIADISAMGADGGFSKIYVSKEAIENLNLIDKGKFVETEAEGDPAYFVAGTVQLHETTEVPVDDEDRLKPGTVAKMLSEDARKYLYPSMKISPSHLFKYAKEHGLREDKNKFDDRYCKWDEQAGVWFYREAFVRKFRKDLIEKPRDTLSKISSKVNVEKFDKHHKKKD